MRGRLEEVSPQSYARAGGLLYLLIFVMAGISFSLQAPSSYPAIPPRRPTTSRLRSRYGASP